MTTLSEMSRVAPSCGILETFENGGETLEEFFLTLIGFNYCVVRVGEFMKMDS